MTPHEQDLNYDFGTLSTDSGFTMTINAGGRYDFPKHDCRDGQDDAEVWHQQSECLQQTGK